MNCDEAKIWLGTNGTNSAIKIIKLIERLALSLEASQKHCIDRQKTIDLAAHRELRLQQRIEEQDKEIAELRRACMQDREKIAKLESLVGYT